MHFEKYFPSDFIAEGLDQTRGWFYTLTVLSSALFGKSAFKACVVSGLVLAKDGRKMSKSLRNYTDPNEVINSFGADALRLFLVNSNVVKAEDLKYCDEGIKDVLKGIIIHVLLEIILEEGRSSSFIHNFQVPGIIIIDSRTGRSAAGQVNIRLIGSGWGYTIETKYRLASLDPRDIENKLFCDPTI